ncbi:hypothetical protein CASFOL_001560 [Castilleja foliolosa]|uniref:F-box domain-containing protein n=1 Tax=Castilleja foliolosa TaxID=1961234 RepID=A0ABD3EJX0_9LAMI
MEPFYTPINIPNIHYAFTNLPTPPIPTHTPTNPWLDMDPHIWSRLPQRLVDRIIASLPAPAFFRARSVCKRWYSLLYSTTFLQLYLHSSPHRHSFLFFKQPPNNQTLKHTTVLQTNTRPTPNPHECYLFDPETLKWYRISIPTIPPGFSPMAASGGLVCYVSDEAGSKNILLANPLTASCIQLPSTLRPRLCPSVGLTITDSSIDMAFAGDDMISPYAVKNLTSESFHIDSGGFYSVWGTTSALPRLCSLESGRMVHVSGRFYCMNYSPFSVLCYDIGANEWSKIQAPMRRFLRSPSLVESRGRLVLVAAVEKSKLNVPRSLRVWVLQEESGSMWVEIERMPGQLYNQFAEMEGGRGFGCVARGEYVVMVIKGVGGKALMFDFGRKRWVWVPPCPFMNGEDELHGFGYEPRLAVPITGILEQLTLPFNSFSG